MERLSEAGQVVAASEPEPSWAIEQARYLLSETMESALRRRPDTDPMRVEVAQVLSSLAGQILAEGAPIDARHACDAAVAHLRRVHDAGGQATRDLAGALHNLAVVGLQTPGTEGPGGAARHATEALRLAVSSPEPDVGTDVELLVAAASLAARTQIDVEVVDPELIVDLGAAADRCVRPPGAATETLRALGFDLTSLATVLARRELPLYSFDVSSAATVVYRTLALREPERYGPDFATALKNCAVLGDRLGRPRAAARYAHTASDWYGRSSERGGPQDEARAAMLLLEARSWLAAGAYADAERPARDAQSVYARLAGSDPGRYAGAHRTAHVLLELARSGAN